jgi:hypothetical protein
MAEKHRNPTGVHGFNDLVHRSSIWEHRDERRGSRTHLRRKQGRGRRGNGAALGMAAGRVTATSVRVRKTPRPVEGSKKNFGASLPRRAARPLLKSDGTTANRALHGGGFLCFSSRSKPRARAPPGSPKREKKRGDDLGLYNGGLRALGGSKSYLNRVWSLDWLR